MAKVRPTRVEYPAGSGADIVIPLSDEDGDPISSFGGWTGAVQLRLGPGLPVLYEWSTAENTLTLADSEATLKAPDVAVSLAWDFHVAWFDLALTDGAGKPARPLPQRGALVVTHAITV